MTIPNQFNPPPPPSTPKHAPWTEAELANAYLYGILQALQPGTGSGGATLNDVLAALNKILAILTNAPGLQTLNVPVTSVNTRISVATMTIPDGFPLVIQSSPLNNAAGLIKVAPIDNSVAPVLLQPGQSVAYRTKTSDSIFISGTIIGDLVILTCEKK